MATRDVTILIKAIDRATPTLKKASTHIRGVGVAMMGLGAVVGAGIGKSIQSFAEFEKVMVNAASVANANAQEYEKMTAFAREMGATTVFSAREAGEAMYFLSSAGFSVEKQMAVTKPVLDLAAATQSGLAETTELTISALNSFQLAASEADAVTNVLAATISSSQATLGKLAIALPYVGAQFNALGYTVETASAALGVLMDRGLGASMAGTRLRAMLGDLLKPSVEARKAINEMGIELEKVNPMTNSLVSIVREFENAGLDAAGATRIFGQRAEGMTLLVAEGADALEEMVKSITGTSRASEMASRQLDTLAGDWKLLTSAVSEAKLVFGDEQTGFGGSARTTLQMVTGLITKFNELDPVVQKLIGTITAATGAASLLGGAGLVFLTQLPKISAGLKLMGGSIGKATVSMIALTASLWAAFRIYEAFTESIDTREGQLRGVTKTMKAQEDALYDLGTAMSRYESQGLDPAAATLGDLDINLKQLNKRLGVNFLETRNVAQAMDILSKRWDDASDHAAGLEKQIEGLEKLGPPISLMAAPREEDPIEDQRAANLEILALRQKLQVQFERLTTTDAQFRIAEANRWAEEQRRLASGDAEAIRLIEQIKAGKIAAIQEQLTASIVAEAKQRRDAAIAAARSTVDAQQQAQIQILQLHGENVKAAEMEAHLSAKAVLDSTGSVELANAVLAGKLQLIKDSELQEEIKTQDRKLTLNEELRVRTLEAQGKMKEAAIERLRMETNELALQGAKQAQITEFYNARMAKINAKYSEDIIKTIRARVSKIKKWLGEELQKAKETIEAREKAEEEVASRLLQLRERTFQSELARINMLMLKYEELGVSQVQIEQLRSAETEALKREETDRILDIEASKLDSIQASTETHARRLVQISDIIFTAQEQGWNHAISMVLRFAAQNLAAVLKQKAQEKIVQAAKAETQAQWHKYHAARLHSLAIESTVLAAIATAEGNIASAAAFTAAATQASAAAQLELTKGGAARAESQRLIAEATKETIAATAIQAGAEIASRKMEQINKMAQERQRIEEQRASEEEKRQEKELNLEKQILELQGRKLEAASMGVQMQKEQLQAAGVSPALIQEWEQLKLAKEGSLGVAVNAGVGQPTGIVNGGLGGGIVQPFGGNVTYQTNVFNGVINLADEDQLRELAEMLDPYNEEIRAKTRA